ncbi:hypothetical protein PXH59_02175 [Xenorhabdus sp. SF857]|uniref:hypothetical protein n=1 Tax=Xenorhabdus bakwenae TaxID=3026967 RepID=UPI002558161E|nr:hypothetical protein [Xenorhabdus sp. SF857]WFQ80020.1 hypothetical protein PXH59_02175 [Xenorhabdus sp. SF857]
MAQDKHVGRSRLPREIAAKKMIPIRLTVEEDEELKVIALEEGRSKASLARTYYLAGKRAAQAQVE